MIEIHPFKEFIPAKATMLILGSFPGKESTQQQRADDWYYGANRNQFWKIMELVYKQSLKSIDEKQNLFQEQGLAITDIIKSCKRRENNNSDKNLIDKIYNTDVIDRIISKFPINKILFTSRGVKAEFDETIEPKLIRKDYQKVILITPSPAYRRNSLVQKAEKYSLELSAIKK